jgi:uncharacterized membrane protein
MKVGVPVAPLVLFYWLHILATTVWIGGLFSLTTFILPAAQRTLTISGQREFLRTIKFRIQQIGWLCLLILIVTGMFQMSANPNYKGFLTIENSWTTAIFLKHLAIGVLLIISGIITWGLAPRLNRVALQARKDPVFENQLQDIEKWEMKLTYINLTLGTVILGLTAWARSAA